MSGEFKRPTIRDDGRAYTRLYTEYLKTPDAWLDFIARYEIKHVKHGIAKHGDCAVQVVDRINGQLAILGVKVPSAIKYHNVVEPSRQLWTEIFVSETRTIKRITEIGGGVKEEVLRG